MLLAFGAWVASAHPSHTTVSEAEFNSETGNLEVALRLKSEDLEDALAQRAGRKFVLERESKDALDEICASYVAATFRVEPKADADLVWIGLEFEGREVWVYFELPLPSPVGDAKIFVEPLMELHAQQFNTVHVRNGESRQTATFSGDERHRLLRDLIGPPNSP